MNMTSANSREARKRLDQNSWIKAAIDELTASGIDGVRVEVLARNLGVTKGSFYAHFREREELHDAILDYWRSRATLALIDRMNQLGKSPQERLHGLISLVVESRSRWGDDAELSIRLWAKRNEKARATLAEVDRLRTCYISNLLLESGLDQSEAGPRALLIYAFMRVAPSFEGIATKGELHEAQIMLLGGNG